MGEPDVFVFCPFSVHFALPSGGVAFELVFYAVEDLLFQWSVWFKRLFPCHVCFRVVGVCWVVEDFVEDAVGSPGCAGADEFSVRRAQRKEHGVVEFFVVWDEVEFVRVDYVESWSADGFGVVRVCFYVAVVVKCDAGFLWFLVCGFWEFLEESVDVFDDEFGLSPAWSDYADVYVRVC